MCNEVCVGIGQFFGQILLFFGVASMLVTSAFLVWTVIKGFRVLLAISAGVIALGASLYLLGVPLILAD